MSRKRHRKYKKPRGMFMAIHWNNLDYHWAYPSLYEMALYVDLKQVTPSLSTAVIDAFVPWDRGTYIRLINMKQEEADILNSFCLLLKGKVLDDV